MGPEMFANIALELQRVHEELDQLKVALVAKSLTSDESGVLVEALDTEMVRGYRAMVIAVDEQDESGAMDWKRRGDTVKSLKRKLLGV